MRPTYTPDDFSHSPLVVFFEVTRACDLMCLHCRADAQKWRDPLELNTEQAKLLFDQLSAFPKPPLVVLTGGDPIKRADVFDLVAYARSLGLSIAMTPSATPLVTKDAISRLKSAGLHRLAVSLDGADAPTHDGFRRVRGSYDRTLEIIADARAIDLEVQINTTVSLHNFRQLDAIADLLSGMDISLWSIFFLIPTGRALANQRITPELYEAAFATIWRQSKKQKYAIKTTEAPHYRRFAIQQAAEEKGTGVALPPVGRRSPFVGTNDGKGVMFISHRGEIYPSGFLPIECGKFPADSVVRVYQESPLFQSLRDPDALGGKCGQCEFRHLCGGSRSRSYALTGDPLAAEPDCIYIPAKVEKTLEPALS
jgi:AdoMet-dependent heme synthase